MNLWQKYVKRNHLKYNEKGSLNIRIQKNRSAENNL